VKHIPNFITSLNLAAGFIAIIFLFNGEMVIASWLILAAMVFDFLDGFASRLLKAYSEIGKELDSLADAVSFGVVPGLIIFQLLRDSLSFHPQILTSWPGYAKICLLIIPSLIPVCAALRLAKFNIDSTQTSSFKGLPTPAAALAVVSIVISEFYSGSALLTSIIKSPLILTIVTIFISALMVSRIPLLSLKFRNIKFKGNEARYMLICLSVISILILGTRAFPLIIPFYIITSLLSRAF
jgi:CDP-diacylglycerol---serine O-phosphatidyltransferase